MADLTVKYGDVEFKNPIVAAAGPLGRTFEALKRSIEAGCGAVTLKSNNATPKETIEPRPSAHILARPAHVFLNKYRLKNMMINWEGVPVEFTAEAQKKALAAEHPPNVVIILADDLGWGLLDALEAEAMLDSTLIWFISDNGGLNPGAVSPGLRNMSERLEGWFGKPLPLLFLEFIRTNALEGGADNRPYRKGKQSVYEGGVRVPSLIHWRGHLTPRRISKMVTAQDVLPTLLGAAGLEVRAAEYDGADQWPLMARDAAVSTPDYVTQGRDGIAFYRFPWKLVELASGEVELYRIDEDPTEQGDRAAAEPSVVEALADALSAFPRGESVNLPLWKILWDVDFFGGDEDREPWADRVN